MYLTYILILINAIVFILETTQGGSTNTNTAIRFGAEYPPLVAQGQWWRLITAMFVHFGFFHIAMNLYALYYTGPVVARYFGTGAYLAVYLLSGFCGNLLTYAIDARRGQNTVSAGASGAIFGLYGCILAIYLVNHITPSTGLILTLVINLAYGLGNRHINMLAHLGGFLAGLILGAVLA